MKKYFWFSIILVSFCLCGFLIATGVLFSHGLEKLRVSAEKRMVTVALYNTQYINYLITNSEIDSVQFNLSHKLQELCTTTGFENIIVCDSSGIVLFSGSDIYTAGENFTPYLMDQALFKKAIRSGEYFFTKPVQIDKITFKSLYFGCVINDQPCVFIVDANQDYFEDAEGFAKIVFIIVILLLIISISLLVVLFILETRAQQAVRKANLNEKLAYLGRTSAELAHELKNPLAIIKSSVDVLRITYDPQKSIRAFTFLSDEVMRLSGLIDKILTFSREQKLERVPLNFREIVDDFVNTRFINQYKGIVVHNEIQQGIRLIGDHHAVEQITANILNNAGSALKDCGEVWVRGVVSGKVYIIQFIDNGPGIPTEIAERIFEPFVSGSKTGTGLGLAIVKTLCEAMGWSIAVKTSEPGNTHFEISIGDGLWEEYS